MAQAKQVATSICTSSLVKTAFYGQGEFPFDRLPFHCLLFLYMFTFNVHFQCSL